MGKNIPSRNMNGRRRIQAVTVLSKLNAVPARDDGGPRVFRVVKGRFESLPVARAEAQVSVGRWNA